MTVGLGVPERGHPRSPHTDYILKVLECLNKCLLERSRPLAFSRCDCGDGVLDACPQQEHALVILISIELLVDVCRSHSCISSFNIEQVARGTFENGERQVLNGSSVAPGGYLTSACKYGRSCVSEL